MGRKKKKSSKPWCWYCNREFVDEKTLIQHQKAKHFRCFLCKRRLYTGPGLTIHCMQVHKQTIDNIPNALPNRNNTEIEIYGMEGIPPGDIKEHERQGNSKVEYSDEDSNSATDVSNKKLATAPTMLSVPGMIPGVPKSGILPSRPYGPPMPGIDHIRAMSMGMPPDYMPTGIPMMGTIHQTILPPSTSIQAPPKPLFPAAIAQASASSYMPVRTDFKPLKKTVQHFTFPAYCGNASPSISGHTSSIQEAAPLLYGTAESKPLPHINSEMKRSAGIICGDNTSSKILHPNEDLSLEEIRAQLPKYQKYCCTNRMSMPIMPGKMPKSSGMMMNGIMRTGTMAVPLGMSGVTMTGTAVSYSAANMCSQNQPVHTPLMGQGGSHLY